MNYILHPRLTTIYEYSPFSFPVSYEKMVSEVAVPQETGIAKDTAEKNSTNKRKCFKLDMLKK